MKSLTLKGGKRTRGEWKEEKEKKSLEYNTWLSGRFGVFSVKSNRIYKVALWIPIITLKRQYGAHTAVHSVYKSLSTICRINIWFGFPELHFGDGSGFVARKQEEGHRGELRWGQGSTEWLIWPSTTGCGPQQDWVLLIIITACALISGHGLTYACVHFCIWLDYCMPISPRRSPGVSPLAEFTRPVKQGHVISTLWLVSYFYFSCIFTVLWISLTPVLKYPWQLWPDSN